MIVGLFEFGKAAQAFTAALQLATDNKIALIKRERGGADIIVDGKLKGRTPGFIDAYPALISKILGLYTEKEAEKSLLEDVQAQIETQKNLCRAGGQIRRPVRRNKKQSGKKSAQKLELLRSLQQRLFDYSLELTDAAERNFAMEREIRRRERQNAIDAGLARQQGRAIDSFR